MKLRIENIVPILRISDMKKSRSFYMGVLGFQEAEWGTDDFTLVFRDNTAIYLSHQSQGSGETWIWIGFDGDIDELYNHVKNSGARVKLPPTNFSYAYEIQVYDPDGHVLRFGTDPDSSKPFTEWK